MMLCWRYSEFAVVYRVGPARHLVGSLRISTVFLTDLVIEVGQLIRTSSGVKMLYKIEFLISRFAYVFM